jgi:hypothetical protein
VSEASDDSARLTALCVLARVCLGATSVSIATVTEDGLHYVAADGRGAREILGTVLPPGKGIAGYVAATGQSLSVRDPTSDARFARDVGERIGYVPSEIQCIAVLDGDGEVTAVLSLLDRTSAGPGTESGQRTLAAVIDIAAAFLDEAVVDDTGMMQRLAVLAPNEKARVAPVVHALLDAFER